MKKLIVLLALIALVASISTAAFAWSSAELSEGTVYWLDFTTTESNYYTTTGGHWAMALNMDVFKATSQDVNTAEQGEKLGNIDTFCLTVHQNLEQGGYAALFTKLDATEGVRYLLGTYWAKTGTTEMDYAYNAALQAAIWHAMDGVNYQLKSGGTDASLAYAQTQYTTFTSALASNLTKAKVLGFDGVNSGRPSQNLAPHAVPEASTLIGFGSALVMAGPGMIGWLKRRRS